MNKKLIIILALAILLLPLSARGAMEEMSEHGIHGLVSVIREETGLDKGESPLLNETFSYSGFESNVTIYASHALLTLPQWPSKDDCFTVLDKSLSLLGVDKFVSYEVYEDSVILYYSEIDAETADYYYSKFSEQLKTVLDSLSSVESANVENEEDEDEKPYKVSFSYSGIKTDIEGYSTHTYVYIPLGVTESDVSSVVSFVLEKDPQFLLSSYTIDGAKVVFSYSEVSLETLLEVVNAFEEYLKAYIDTIFSSVPVEESSAPTSSFFDFSLSIDGGIRGKIKYEKGSTHIFPSLAVRADMTLKNCVFVEANAQFMFYKNNNYRILVGSAEAIGGLRLGNDIFSIFGYGGARYTIATKNSGFTGGFGSTFGGGIVLGLGNYFDIKVLYEHFNDDNFFNVSLGIRF